MTRNDAAAITALLLSLACATAGADGGLRFSALSPLPPAPGNDVQPGVAGPFVGAHNGTLIVAGGANFPEKLPWRGGKKVWHDEIYVLIEDAAGAPAWRTGWQLERPLAYGAAVSTKEGVICIGGCDADRCYRDVFLLRWNPDAEAVTRKPLAPLPRPLAFAAAGLAGTTVFVAGGQESMRDAVATTDFFAFDSAANRWREPPSWPGPPRILPAAAAQHDGTTDCFYLFGGRHIAPERPTAILTDAWVYRPDRRAWESLGEVRPEGAAAPLSVMAAPALPAGTASILVFGGARGKLLVRLDELDRRIASAAGAEKETLAAEKNRILENHPGFSRDVLAFNTVTRTWTRIGTVPGPAPVTTIAARWRGRIVIPSGEIRPGVRTSAVRAAAPPAPPPFGVLNYTVLGIYLAALVAMGFYFSRREKTTDDFFRAGRRIPWWAAGISIFGTQLSAITFIAIPAKTYATDWRYFMFNMAIIMVAPVVVFLFLPFYRRLNVTTAYEYLEKRFNLVARLAGSAMFVLLQFGRIGVVLFIPSIVLSVVTGIDVRVCIVLMGGLSILYTVLGGIEAVIWTDVMQVVVLVGGAILATAVMLLGLDEGPAASLAAAGAAGKLHTFDCALDLRSPTLWTVVLGGAAASLISYGTDQAVVQRYLTTRDERQAARGIWTNAVLTVPASLLFFFVGTALFLFYRDNPGAANPALEPADAIFPWFIVTELRPGVAGMVIAAIFAASMSSLDSSMNSVAAAVTTDWFRRFRGGATERSALAVARWATVLIGAAGTVFALVMASWEFTSLWDQFNRLLGLFAGGLGGLFLLGMLTRRANGIGAIAGLAASGAVQYLVKAHTAVHLLLYTLTGMASCLAVGYAVSLLSGGGGKPLAGLTVYTQQQRKDQR